MRSLVAFGAVVTALLAATQARGHTEPEAAVPPSRASPCAEGDCPCPDPREVAASLAELLRADGAEPVPDAAVHLVDEGETWRMVVAGRETTYRDPDRNCAERAHVAAVAAALTLRPPRLSLPTPPASPSPPPPPPPPAPRAAMRLLLEAGPAISMALHDGGGRAAAGGGDIRAILRLPRIDVAASAGFRMSSDYQLDGVTAGVTRVPFGLTVGARTQGRRIELALRAGIAGAVLSVTARDLTQAPRRTRLELGPGAAVQIAWPASSRLAAVAGASAAWMPRPYVLDVAPDGPIGHSAWLHLETYIALRVSLLQ